MPGGVEVAAAYVTLTVDGSRVTPGVKSALKGTESEAARSGKEAGKRYSAGISGSLGGTAKLLGGLFAVDKAKDFFKGAVEGASDLNEAGTKINAIFGRSGAAAVQRFASAGAQQLGQTRLAVLDAASTFGTFGKAAGLAGGPLADFSTKFAGLSTDLASFYNTSPEDAIEAIGSALRGEAEPIRKYGVLLDDATLRQEALRLGLIKTTKNALTPQQRVLAAQAAIYKQTKDAQGDFARTSGGLANQQRILKAELSDAQAQLGTKLLPALVTGAKAANQFITEMKNGTGTGGAFADAVGGVGDVIKPIAKTAIGAAEAFGHLPGPIKQTALAAAALYLIGPRVSSGLGAIGTSATTNLAKVKQFRAELSYTETRSAAVGKAAYALGGSLRNVAGGAGFALLANSAGQSSTALGIAEKAAGGAALGLSVGGPLGAAIGGLGGAVLGFVGNLKKNATQFDVSKEAAKQYAASLDTVSGAATSATRAIALQSLGPKVLKAGAQAGLSQRTLVDAVIGDPKAIKAVDDAVAGLNQRSKALKSTAGQVTPGTGANGAAKSAAETAKYAEKAKEARAAADALSKSVGNNSTALANQAKKTRLAYFANTDLATLLKGFPKNVVTQIKANGVEHSEAAVAALAKQYNLTPKQINTVAGIAGFDDGIEKSRRLRESILGIPKGTITRAYTPGAVGAKAALDLVTAAAKNAGKQKPSPQVTAKTAAYYAALRKAKRDGDNTSASVKVKADTSSFFGSLFKAVAAAGRAAASVKVPKRAAGGPIAARQLTLVGERGPELVSFPQSGTVIPNNKIASYASPVAPAAMGGFAGPARFVLRLDDGTPLTGHIERVAENVVASDRALGSMGRR